MENREDKLNRELKKVQHIKQMLDGLKISRMEPNPFCESLRKTALREMQDCFDQDRRWSGDQKTFLYEILMKGLFGDGILTLLDSL